MSTCLRKSVLAVASMLFVSVLVSPAYAEATEASQGIQYGTTPTSHPPVAQSESQKEHSERCRCRMSRIAEQQAKLALPKDLVGQSGKPRCKKKE